MWDLIYLEGRLFWESHIRYGDGGMILEVGIGDWMTVKQVASDCIESWDCAQYQVEGTHTFHTGFYNLDSQPPALDQPRKWSTRLHSDQPINASFRQVSCQIHNDLTMSLLFFLSPLSLLALLNSPPHSPFLEVGCDGEMTIYQPCGVVGERWSFWCF